MGVAYNPIDRGGIEFLNHCAQSFYTFQTMRPPSTFDIPAEIASKPFTDVTDVAATRSSISNSGPNRR